MQTASILAVNPDASVYTISSVAHQGIEELLRALKKAVEENSKRGQAAEKSTEDTNNHLENRTDIPRIELSASAIKDAWSVQPELNEDGVIEKFVVRGEKIEKFARRTDLTNYASVNRLRDIMKKLGIKAELTTQGAKDDSIISIAGKEFTLMEEDW